MDVILLPIGEWNRILNQVARGNVTELITETHQGDHERMKQNVNGIALVLQRFQAELSKLIDYSKRGQLDKRARPLVSRVRSVKWSSVRTRCWMPYCCPSARAIASSGKSAVEICGRRSPSIARATTSA